MPEVFLQYIWQKALFRSLPQHCEDGREVEVVDVGSLNRNAGPDFSAAVIRIGDETWAGNVEIHVQSSDWYKHKHHQDSAYDSVILHVVKQIDKPVFTSQGRQVVQMELQYGNEEEALLKMLRERVPMCAQTIARRPSIMQTEWKWALLSERLMCKKNAIDQLLSLTQNDWQQAFYITLAHNFGFHTNGLPFELTARLTPLASIRKHKHSLLQLEALLMGQSGLLTENTATDEYSRRLWTEYQFLQKKFTLQPIDGSMWKMARMRPQNFPHIRLAQFAAILFYTESLLGQILTPLSLKEYRQLFAVAASPYWQTHYRFGHELPAKEGKQRGAIGGATIDLILINTVVPYLYAWGIAHHQESVIQQAGELLQHLPAEKNSIVTNWKQLGLSVRSAADSQAYLQLHHSYCLQERCLSCDIGFQIFTPMD